jgi:DNA-directed RNA polymerase subunit RPC12/RpoP
MIAPTTAICVHCKQQAVWVPGRGYVHQEGGTYMMHCPDCGWQGAPWPSPAECPSCGSKNLRDEHCVLPTRSGLPTLKGAVPS